MKQLCTLLVLSILIGLCFGHGFLAKPAARNNMKRVLEANKPTECAYGAGKCTIPEVNYIRQGLAAGGPGVVHANCPFGATYCQPQHGMCGDKFDETQDHMEGGKYSSGLLNGVYAPGQTIQMDLHVTAHHNGYHEFTLYDVSDDATVTTVTTYATPSYRLKQFQPASTHTKCEYWNIDPTYNWCMPRPTGPSIIEGGYNYTVAFILPADVTCKRCVLQWHWVTGNSPGGADPEEFWNCADISIRSSGPYLNDKVDASLLTVDGGNAPGVAGPTGPPQPTIPPPPAGAVCIAVAGRGISDDWCRAVKCQVDYVLGGFCQYSIKSTTTSAPPPVSATTKPTPTPTPSPVPYIIAPVTVAAVAPPTVAPTTIAPVVVPTGQSCMTWTQVKTLQWSSDGNTITQYTATVMAEKALPEFRFKLETSGRIQGIWDAILENGSYKLPSWVYTNGVIPKGTSYTFGYIIVSDQPATITVQGNPCQ